MTSIVKTSVPIYVRNGGIEYYEVDEIKYDTRFPVEWACNRLVTKIEGDEQLYSYGPEICEKCEETGCINGIFVGYCNSCLEDIYDNHYEERGHFNHRYYEYSEGHQDIILSQRVDWGSLHYADLENEKRQCDDIWAKYPYTYGKDFNCYNQKSESAFMDKQTHGYLGVRNLEYHNNKIDWETHNKPKNK